LLRGYFASGFSGTGQALLGIFVPCVLLYGLFCIGTLGAGDVKLLGMAGAFLGWRGSLYCVFFSFLAGAVLSIGQMCRYGVFHARLRRVTGYIGEVLRTGSIAAYEDDASPGGHIHFTLAILTGVLLTMLLIGKGVT